MDLDVALHNLGALLTFALGAVGLARPRALTRLAGFPADEGEARAHLRALHGGFLAALGAFALLAQDVVVFTGLGAGWLGAGFGRALAAGLDGTRSSHAWARIVLEGGLGLLLLAPG